MILEFEIPGFIIKEQINKLAQKNNIIIIDESEITSGYMGCQILLRMVVKGNLENIKNFKKEVKEFLKTL